MQMGRDLKMLLNSNQPISHESEFTEVKSMLFRECLLSVAEFKKEAYSKLFRMFMPAIASYLQNLNQS
jgi:hypothetical protein